MGIPRTAWLALGAGALLLAGGCQTLGSCKQPLSEATAPQIPPLRMPAGLDGPDTRQALEIPPLAAPEAPRGMDDPCLQDPPAMREPGSQTPVLDEDPSAELEPRPKRRGPVSPPR